MYLHKIYLDTRTREVRRDLADPYEMHSTLCRAFSPSDIKCPAGEFLWRLEPETSPNGQPRVIIQSRTLPDWSRIGVRNWLAEIPPDGIDLNAKLHLDSLRPGVKFRYRLRANPTVTRNGKRLGLLKTIEQEQWLARKGREQHGFELSLLDSAVEERRVSVRITQERMLCGNRRNGAGIRVFSVLFDGILSVKEPDKFLMVLQSGIGHGKAMGLGMLSIAPVL